MQDIARMLYEPSALLVQKCGRGTYCPYKIYSFQMRHGLNCLRACVGCGVGLLPQSL